MKSLVLTCSLCRIGQCAMGQCLLVTTFLFILFGSIRIKAEYISVNIGCESPTFPDIDHGHLLALGFGSMDLEDLRPLYSCF